MCTALRETACKRASDSASRARDDDYATFYLHEAAGRGTRVPTTTTAVMISMIEPNHTVGGKTPTSPASAEHPKSAPADAAANMMKRPALPAAMTKRCRTSTTIGMARSLRLEP